MAESLWKRMDLAQRIATMALAALCLITLIACGAHETKGRTLSTPTAASTSIPPGDTATASSGSAPTSGDLLTPSPMDGLDSIPLITLSQQAQRTVELIDAGGPFPYSRDGVVFSNYKGALPKKPRGWYHEYTVPTPDASNRGVRRIIKGKDGSLYYTGDHYQTFERILR